ncbi:hypothetical protein [Legionella quateirensis]|uniref:Uncharacterized protein n=1 Tax=Legionella quateirensis TaxID=45072 RepID=A0A378KVA6_9GAMM|nr:hypothetical protein [Legionella quateirensis]KTD47742.1 hypothetical protein Lqua_2135 [Legionella quateirensis]STY18495.1 Uncharacterised protein [Legionella quateirensis]
MKMKLQLFTLGILFSVNVFADGYYPELTSQDQPWTVTASVGNGRFQDIYSKDGKTVIGRLALGNELMLSGDFALGLELGMQNGNQMRLNIPNETLAVLEWLPVKTTLGPMLDLLITAKSDPLFGSSFFAQLKGGVAYRYWQVEHRPIKEISQLAGELQAGFGYPITALASLNVLYQGVYGNDPKLKFYTSTKTASISNIPILHAVLLGLTVNL